MRAKPESPAKCEVVLIDHGLHVAVPRDFRRAYCQLWTALALADEDGLKASCEALGVQGDDYKAFPWLLGYMPYDNWKRRTMPTPADLARMARTGELKGVGDAAFLNRLPYVFVAVRAGTSRGAFEMPRAIRRGGVVSTECPRRDHGGAATRLSTEYPRRGRAPSPRNIRLAAAASPRPRLHGISAQVACTVEDPCSTPILSSAMDFLSCAPVLPAAEEEPDASAKETDASTAAAATAAEYASCDAMDAPRGLAPPTRAAPPKRRTSAPRRAPG